MIKLNCGHGEYTTTPVWARYGNNRIALELVDAEDGEPIIRASVNLVDEPMEPVEMALNHDCAGPLEDALVAAGLIDRHHREVRPNGSWVSFWICRVKEQRQ